jgi:UDP:flavonoid glycosyltransferase YjiC (YdhE family)
VLFAWELGSGLGHVRRIFPIAREVRALGHEVTVALRDSEFLDAASAEGFEVLAAPLLRAPPEVNPSPISHSDVLLNLGFDDVRALHGALRAWRSMLELLAPQVVVADYAPTALVAASLAGVPRVTVGSGFALPPAGDPVPALRPWVAIDRAVLKALDDRLVQRVRAAAGGPAGPALASAPALFAADAHLLCTFPEIDPFGPRAGVDYLGAPGSDDAALEVHWSGKPGPRVLAYLKPGTARFDAVIAGLAALQAEVIVAAPGIAAERAQGLSTGSMRVLAEPVRLDPLVPGASVCVSHAGPGFAARALVAGVPLALLPLQLEQFLIAQRIEKAGAGALSSPERPAPDFREWFASLLDSGSLREGARRQGEAHRGHSFARAARGAAERIVALARA